MPKIGSTELLIILFIVGFYIIPFWRICKNVGYPGWYCLAAFVPLLNILALFLFAFSEWPIEREKKQVSV